MTSFYTEPLLFPSNVPSHLSLLLRSLGWQVSSELPGKYTAWSRPGLGADEILEPADRDADDAEYMINRALALLSRIHGDAAVSRARATLALGVGDLQATRWHKETTVAPGLIRWPDGEELFHSARDQLAAAAKARQEFRPYFGPANAFVARDFLGKCFLGQSDVGSYVLTAHTPRQAMAYVSASFTEGANASTKKRGRSAFSGEEIMRTFEGAVSTIRSSLDERLDKDRLASVKAAVPYGVSYELTSALARFIDGGDCAIEFGRGLTGDTHSSGREIAFDAPESSLLKKAAESFLQERGPLHTSVRGVVTNLQHEHGTPDRIVRIFCGGRGPGQRLRLQLSEEQYKHALRAHDEDRWVQVTGTLVREGRLSWMRSPERLEVVGDGEAEQDALFED